MGHRLTLALAGLLALRPEPGEARSSYAAPRPTGAGVESMPREAQNALVNDFCSGCHSEKTKKGDLILEGFDAASPFLGAELLEKMILKVRTGAMPPPDSNRPEPEVLRAFAETFERRADESAARRADPGWRPFVRLNRAEYARAVHDLLAVDIDAGAFLPADTTSGGFDNIAEAQTVSPALITAYLRGASMVSRLAVGGAESRRRLFSCVPRSRAEEAVCAAGIIRRITDAAYRGLSADEDRAAAMTFFERGRVTGGFESGIRLAVQSILANPKFLFRVEPAGGEATSSQAIDDRALGSRLSFFLWSSAPDALLLKAANQGTLRTADGIAAQVRRMLLDPRSDALSTRFAAQWLHLQDLTRSTPDPTLFPAFDAELGRDMRRETELFVSDVFRSDASVLSLITSDRSFVNERLAAHYGLAGVKGSRFRPVPMPSDRRGLLGQGSILTLTSLGNRTSPVLRGKWVLDVLLGTPPPPPPPNVPALDDTLKPSRNGTPLSTRQRVEEHRRNPACASCHRVIDPPGLALEAFDAIGAGRARDNGVPIDVAAELADGRRIEGPAGLREMLLAQQDQVLRNFAAQLLTYAINRRVGPRDMPAVRAIVRRASAHDNRFSEFILGVVTSDAFRKANPMEKR